MPKQDFRGVEPALIAYTLHQSKKAMMDEAERLCELTMLDLSIERIADKYEGLRCLRKLLDVEADLYTALKIGTETRMFGFLKGGHLMILREVSSNY